MYPGTMARSRSSNTEEEIRFRLVRLSGAGLPDWPTFNKTMSKLTKFLEQHGSVLETHESGSTYYKLAEKRIRLSDHLALHNDFDILSILLPVGTQKQYIVVLGGKLYIHNSYTSLRVFLEHWMLLAKSATIKAEVIDRSEITKLKKKIALLEQNLLVSNGSPFTGFTVPQRNVIASFMKQNKKGKA